MSAEAYRKGWRRSALIRGAFSGENSDIDYTVWKLGHDPGPWVYVVSARGSGRVKIGFTETRLIDRMKGFETGCPFPTRVLALIRGGREMEREVHDALAQHRVHLEWFADSDEIRAWLRRFCESRSSVTWGLDRTD